MTDPDEKTTPADDAAPEETVETTTSPRRSRHAMPDDLVGESAADESDDDAEISDEDDSEGEADDADLDEESVTDSDAEAEKSWPRVVAFAVLPALALILALGAGYLTWQEVTEKRDTAASEEAVAAAKSTTTKLLSYQPDTVEQQLVAARDLLTGRFLQTYTALTNDVVIPGAKEQRISAAASTPDAAAISADTRKAEVLVMINQTVSVGEKPPTSTASTVRLKLEKVGDRWLISEFTPV